MKRFLLFVMMCVCVSIGAWAAKYGNVEVSIDGSTATIISSNAGDINSAWWNGLNGALSGKTTIVVNGPVNDNDIGMISDPHNGANSLKKLDLVNASGSFGINSGNQTIESVVYKSESNFAPSYPASVKYLIAQPVNPATEDNPLVVKVLSGTEWANDSYVANADYIHVEDNDLTEESDIIQELAKTHKIKVNDAADYIGHVSELIDVTVNIGNGDNVSNKIKDVLDANNKINNLTITNGELADLSVLRGVVVAGDVDLSGITNESIDGLVLPICSGNVSLPGSTYTAVTSTVANSDLSKLSSSLKVLTSSGKEINTVTTSNGTSYSSNELTLNAADESSFSTIYTAMKDGGLTVDKISFPSGYTYENGKLTITDTSYSTNLDAILGYLAAASLNVSSVDFPSGTSFKDGFLDIASADENSANLTDIANALQNHGLTVSSVRLATNSTRWEGTRNDASSSNITVSSSLTDEQKDSEQALLASAGFLGTVAQSSHPDVEISAVDGVVTIKSYRAGAAKELLEASDDEATNAKNLLAATSSTKLVFDGPFNANDLSAVASKDNDAVTSVNMSEATFENYSDMKFTDWSSTITNAVTSNYAPDDYYVGKTNGTFSGCSKLESVTYNSGIVDGVENNADDIKKFTTVVIGSNVKRIATKAFFNIASITTLNTTAADKLTVIGNSAFMGCTSFSGDGTGDFHIPNSVQTIEESAFEACYGLVNLYFDADSHISSIQKKAFYMTNEGATQLKNVYVNVNPAREVPCAKETFNKTDCCNQTAVGTARLRLHYPPKYYDFYVGEYKTQYNGGGITQTYLDQAYRAATNGWQEIMSSGILMPAGVNWRTFSDEVPYYVPESPAADHTVREIYLVHGYDAAKNAAILVKMKVGDIIPKNTGVIVHYTFNSSNGAALYLPPVLTDQRDSEGHVIGRIVDPVADAKTPYDEELYPSNDKRYKPTGGTEYFKNYLKKLNKETVYIDNVEIKDGVKTYRNFFFCNNDDLKKAEAKYKGKEWSEECLKGWGFLRAMHGSYTISNKAYLHYPATGEFPGAQSVGVNTEEPNASASSAKQFGFITIDENGFEFECAPVLPGIATAIKNAEAIVSDDCFYNMQGMKVENPSKGIYIKNGKKYVIK
jgi:hypothetical protein